MTDCTKRKTCNKIVGNPYEWQNPCPCRDYEQELNEYKWIDLRKDPENLPEEGRIIIATDGEDYFCGKTKKYPNGIALEMLFYHNDDDFYTSNEEYILGSVLTAWRYFELF